MAPPAGGAIIGAMLFAIRLKRGGPWDFSLGLREQTGWEEHARFMDRLVAEGFIALGGPLDPGHEVLLIVHAASEAEIHARLAEDNWHQDGHLTIASIERWTVLLDGLGLRDGSPSS